MVGKKTAKAKMAFWSPIQTIILTISVYLTSQFGAGLAIVGLPTLIGVSSSSLDTWLDSDFGQFVFIVLIEGLVMLLLWGLLHLKKSTFSEIGLAWPRWKDLGIAVLGFGVYFLMYLVISGFARVIFPSIDFNQEQQIGFATSQTSFDLFMIFISLVVLPPFVEEVLARGFLYTGLKSRWPIWPSVIVTSAMFAVAHLQFGSGAPLLWVAAIDTFTLSLVLIYLREKTGNLGASIALHMLKNGLAFMLLFVFQVR